ncbi:TonB-dependent siderophore receptor [Paracandidimonas soli]|uniref:Iron complex outermembrane receptor protein n=1 Tax=Paracandidimonas soli TaxID=1917182 RepID=A0A4V6P2P4_9BURK|nr:TonB-dependent siderophore receptor [Paracandidimonas soli]TCU97269.1 iron complex outermembrane receptor protein [Paracandidimonas soli]
MSIWRGPVVPAARPASNQNRIDQVNHICTKPHEAAMLSRSNTRSGRKRISALLIALAASSALMPPLAAAEQDAPRQIRIAAQPLGKALLQLGEQTSLQIFYAQEIVDGLMASAVSGSLPPEEALARLLRGTPLTYRRNGDTITLSRQDSATQLDRITVTGQADDTVQVKGYVATWTTTGSKTATPILEMPQTVNVIGREEIEARGAQSIIEATRYTPGVIPTFGDSDSRGDTLQSRGFYLRHNYNGARLPYGAHSFAMLRMEPYGLERIEVLKGPTSMLYGQSTPGGLVNMVSKRPVAGSLREVQVQGGTHKRRQLGLDISERFGSDDQFGVRLTGLARDADGEVDYGYDKREFIAPSFQWKPSADTELLVFGHYQRDRTISDYAPLPAAGTHLPNPNGEFPTNRYPGEPDFDGYERKQAAVGYKFTHRFNDTWRVEQSGQWSRVEVDTTASPGYMLDPSQRFLSRVASHGKGDADTINLDTNLQAVFNTAGLEHTLLLGVDYLHIDNTYNFASGLYGTPLDLYDPQYGQPVPDLIPRIDYRQKREQVGGYFQDQIRYGRWFATLGGRYDRSSARTRNQLPAPSSATQTDTAFTGRVGLGYRFDMGLAPYVSYSTSFEPLDGSDYFGEMFKPMKGRQMEAGIKYQLPDGNSLVTLSAFELVQRNGLTPDERPGHTGFSVQTGEARLRGVELEAKASLNDNLDLVASYAYNQSKVTKANANAGGVSTEGNELVMVPRQQASLWLNYQFAQGPLQGLSAGAGTRYVGKSYGDAANTQRIAAHTLWDAALNYDFGPRSPALDGLSLRLTASNLADKRYVGYCQGPLQCYFGQGRVVLATLRYRW